MKLYGLILLFLFIQPLPPLPRQAANNQTEKANANSQEDNQGKTVSSPPPSAGSGTNCDANSHNTYNFTDTQPESTKKSESWSRADIIAALSALFTGLLVIIAFGTGIAVAWQAQKTAEATQAMRDSIPFQETTAKATQSNVDALINTERAWIMADIRWTAEMSPKLVPRPTTMKTVSHSSGISADVCLICKNDGRTPAWITNKRILFRIETAIPKPPPLGRMHEPRSGDFFAYGPEPIGVGQEVIEQPHFLNSDTPFEPGSILLIYGYVQYRDIFSPKRETRFGYMSTDGKTLVRIPDQRVDLPALGVSEDFWHYNSYT